jgi:hypothetical protein
VTSQRVLTLVEMVRRFNEARDVGARDGGGDGGAVPLMSLVWNESFRELERVLLRMRAESAESIEQYWHLSERYLRPRERQAWLAFRAGRYAGLRSHEGVLKGFAGPFDPIWPDATARDKKNKGAPEGWTIVQTWDERVSPGLVRAGFETLDAWFPGEPFLPDEMLEAA